MLWFMSLGVDDLFCYKLDYYYLIYIIKSPLDIFPLNE